MTLVSISAQNAGGKSSKEVRSVTGLTEAEIAAKADLGVEPGQILYVISDYDYTLLQAEIKRIAKSYNEKYFHAKEHDYIVIYVEYLDRKTGGVVAFYPRDFGKYVFTKKEDAGKANAPIENLRPKYETFLQTAKGQKWKQLWVTQTGSKDDGDFRDYLCDFHPELLR